MYLMDTNEAKVIAKATNKLLIAVKYNDSWLHRLIHLGQIHK